MKKHIITEEEYKKVNAEMKLNKNKRIDKRLEVIKLRYEGKKDYEIAEKLNYSLKRISQLCAEFKKEGIEKYISNKYSGNNRAMSLKQEQEILDKFKVKAEKGQIVTVKEIKAEFDKKRTKESGRGYIYMLLARHHWRMVMPRGQHPKKASEAKIEASKKLTILTKN